MTTAATSLLGLALPVSGELSGTWGDTVNTSITALLDSAVAGTTTISVDADITLSATTLAANEAREAIILWTAGGTVTRYITAPAQSKTYVVINKTSSTQSIVIRGVGPTTGVTIVAGRRAVVAWNGVDFIEVASGNVNGAASSTDNAIARFDGTTGKLVQNSVVTVSDLGVLAGITDISGNPTMSSGTANGVVYLNGAKSLTSGTALTFDGAQLNVNGITVGRGGGAVATNTAVGDSALSSNTTSDGNTAMGYQTLQNATSGSSTAVGAYALRDNVSGSAVAVGYASLIRNTTGENNTAVGNSALAYSVTSDGNTAIGAQALENTTASGNTAVGALAMVDNIDGFDNTALGAYALLVNNASQNTAVGNSALTANTTGASNVAVGYNSGSAVTTGSNNVILGGYTGLGAPISGTGSNWVVLSDGAGNVRQAIDPAGNVQSQTGAAVVYAPAPAAISTTATLTNANLQAQLINTTGTSYTVTMPLGTTLDTLISWSKVDIGFDFSVINTASGTITMAANTGVTTLGGLTIATGTSARFRIRRTAANTFVMYRI
jgi:hypothetical protein